LTTVDRVAYPTYDSLATLAAAAGATSRIGLVTNILLAPVYPSALLAKATASLDQLSGGRLTLGLAPGGRPDDFAVVGRDFHTRGRDLDAELEVLHGAWAGEVIEGSAGEAVSPPPAQGDRVPILFGGFSGKAFARMAQWGAGYTVGGVPSVAAPAIVEQAQAAWKNAGRDGEPRIAALAYYSLDDDSAGDWADYLRDYYRFLGDFVEQIIQGALRTREAIRSEVAGFEAAGVTELYLNPTTGSLDQVDRLADLLF